jgi:hypothetical protein
MIGTLGTGSGLIALFATSSLFRSSPPPPPPTVAATKDGALFERWAADDESLWSEGVPNLEPECTWWNGSITFTSDLCSHFSLSRMASSSASRAIERAIKCAAFFETECVLSPEIGVSIPAAFVYDHESSGMKMIIAPRILPSEIGDVRAVRVQDQTESTNGFVRQFNSSVRIEFLPGGSRAPVSETLNGSDAYCVQLLREAFSAECWTQLD